MSGPGDSVHPHTRTVRDGGYMKTITDPGLTKRELLAAMAMQGLLASFEAHRMPVQSCAPLSVKAADAILAELAKDGVP